MAIVLAGGAVLTVNAADEFLPAADIRIEGARIAAIGAAGTLAQPADQVIDASEALVTPGLVNVHTHAATAFFRGLADDRPRSFWEGYAVPGQETFTLDHYKTSVRAACSEFLLNGITCIADRLGDMQHIAPVVEQTGIRAVVGHTITDNRVPADWRTVEGLLERYGTDPRARVSAGIAPHALDTCSDALLKECARRAERTGARVFIHVAQSEPEVAAVQARGHAGALACLAASGLATANTVAAHALYLSEAEIDAWPTYGIPIAHCPASNLKIEARTLPLARLAGRVPIGLGTDWTVTNNSMDLLAEARLAALVGKMRADDPTVLGVRQMMRMLTIDGARVLGIERQTGSIEPGKHADLAIFDLARLEANPAHDLASNLIYSISPRSVRDVMVDGELLVRNGKLVRDDEAILARASRHLGAAG
ncbi:5-methylthioadenosine/S-adenosylhomocysteine deaminase [Enhydrobacter aerosaccus]|uniref:5-methylthioadenosine/S-adenosylhomocysteine deaminase n=1 Tax=Enhydrobacter aerosaccus TaxID=225324 RepID=A0A1T4MQD4_9HYPH|nr:amidohydrolase family protein [Enhydrobacter aerosaccus]SJZ69004.1 5-methylthioadenosine/S-adenosylhomocysteine deaminase [Enhydrobacter aerosaccus]